MVKSKVKIRIEERKCIFHVSNSVLIRLIFRHVYYTCLAKLI